MKKWIFLPTMLFIGMLCLGAPAMADSSFDQNLITADSAGNTTIDAGFLKQYADASEATLYRSDMASHGDNRRTMTKQGGKWVDSKADFTSTNALAEIAVYLPEYDVWVPDIFIRNQEATKEPQGKAKAGQYVDNGRNGANAVVKLIQK